MGYSYDINLSKKDKSSSVCLFTCHMIFTVVILFLHTFLVAHIYSLSDNVYEYIKNVAIYEICQYACMFIFIPIFSVFVEKTNRTWIYRLGVLVLAGLVVFAIFYGQVLSQYIVLAGIIYGIANALYYSAYNTLKQEMVSRKSMKTFAVFQSAVPYLIKIIVPTLMGALIDVSTYSQVAIYVLIICAIQIGFSFGVRAKRPENSVYDLKGFVKKINELPETKKKLKIIYITSLIYGFCTVIEISVQICIMIQFGSSFSLGTLTSVFSALSIVTIFLVNKFTRAGKRTILYVFDALLPIICTWIFCFFPTVWTLILYNVGIAISKVIFGTIFDIYRNGILKEAGLYSEITEHQSVVEGLLNFSRVISYAALVLLIFLNNLSVFYVYLGISILSYPGIIICLNIYEKKFLAHNKEKDDISQIDLIDDT